MRRWLVLAAVMVFVLELFAPAMADSAQMSRTEPLYSEVRAGYGLPVYEGEPLETSCDVTVRVGDSADVSVTAPADGQYEVWLTYKNVTDSTLATELVLKVDGGLPFYELRRVKLSSLWVTGSDTIPVDRYGNEIAPSTVPADVWQTVGVTDSTGRIDVPFLFEMTAGAHTLTFDCQDSGVSISAVSLRAPVQVSAYAGGEAAGKSMIVIEGEDISGRSKSSIRGAGEFNASLTPYSTDHRVLNHLDGASFDTAGDTVTYTFTAEEEGWYMLDLHYRQAVKADFPVFLDILIDGALPSGAASNVHMDYATSFTDMTVQADGKAQTFFLSGGEHTLSFRINAAILTPVYEMIDRVLGEINALSLEVTRLSGGSADQYRSYNVREYIPDIEDRLNGWADDCEASVEYVKRYSSSGSGSAFSSLTLCADQLRRLAEKPEDLPRRLTELSTGSNSASRMLAQQLQDMANNDLSIDQIIFYQKDASLPSRAGFFARTGKSVERFVTSFSSQDYAAGSGSDDHLQVWMGRSRQYVELLQNLIDMEFTPETGIVVDISLMPDANKLVLSNAAGTAPDVVLSLQYVVPSYLNIRGALYDLTQFPDFGEVAQRFSAGLFIPYTLGEGVYAMPETVNFWVMFYRKDILSALSIDVPDSLEEVKLILPELQRRNMNFYYPTAGMSGLKVFPGTLPLILQSGGSIYADTIGDTTLDSDASLQGFRELTELFTVYNMPTDVPSPGFYQQFRDGTLPIGIADLATYNLLLNAAPELDSLWDIALFPGMEQADGTVARWTTGGAETMAILSQTDKPDQAWEFLKWWSSEDVQSRFGSLLQSTYGSEYIWPTANTEAFDTLPLKSAHKKVIMAQMEWMTEAPWVLGTYMLERELSNAYISVVVDGTDARRALDTAVKRINRETYRKLEEFGYYKDGEMLKEFKTPTVDVVQSYIDAWNAAHPAGEEEQQQ